MNGQLKIFSQNLRLIKMNCLRVGNTSQTQYIIYNVVFFSLKEERKYSARFHFCYFVDIREPIYERSFALLFLPEKSFLS